MSYKYSPPEGTPPNVTRADIVQEFRRWNDQAGEIVIAADFDMPLAKDGTREAAARFLLRGRPMRIAIDKWPNFATNLKCVYLLIRDMRLGEARGMTEAIREAYAQLPAGKVDRDPYEVLGVRSDVALEDIEAMYRAKARRLHPDTASGDADLMKELNAAIERIRSEKKAVAK